MKKIKLAGKLKMILQKKNSCTGKYTNKRGRQSTSTCSRSKLSYWKSSRRHGLPNITAILTSAGKWPLLWLKSSKTLQDQWRHHPKNEEHYQNWAQCCATQKSRFWRGPKRQPEEKIEENWDGDGEEEGYCQHGRETTRKSCDQRTSTLPSSRVSTEINGKSGEIKKARYSVRES